MVKFVEGVVRLIAMAAGLFITVLVSPFMILAIWTVESPPNWKRGLLEFAFSPAIIVLLMLGIIENIADFNPSAKTRNGVLQRAISWFVFLVYWTAVEIFFLLLIRSH